MENGCICTTGGVSVRAVGAAASLLCTALVMATDPACAPGAGDCFAPGGNGSPGCDDVDCCRTICSCDPFCCSTAWDGYCAGSGYVAGCGAALLCNQPPAACCIDGVCSELNSGDCAAAGGVYMGAGTTCATTVCGTAPANDDCENAIALACDDVVTFDNTFATTQPEWEVPLSCYFGGPDLMTGSVWFTIDGTGDTIQLDTCSSLGSPDTLIVVYSEGSSVADCAVIGLEVACSEDACGLLSRLCIDTEAGVQYLVGVGSFDDASRGEITLTVTCPCPVGACCFSQDGSCTDTAESLCQAAGGQYQGDGTACATTVCPVFPDECAFPQEILCGESITIDQTLGTTNVTDPPFSCHFGGPAQGVNSAWFSFVATEESAVISTCDSPSTLDTLIAVYDGSCGSLVEIACSEDAGCGPNGFLSEVCASGLTIGNTYIVQVGAFSAADAGMTTVSLTCPCPPPPTVECPKGSTLENEANCGLPTDTVNGGCNSTPNVFTSISCGETICGTAAFDGATRDTDWFEVVVTEPTVFTWTTTATFDSLVGKLGQIVDGVPGCANLTGFIDPAGFPLAGETSVITTECLPAGTYYFFIAPLFGATVPCGGVDNIQYVVTLDCQSPCVVPTGACCFPDQSCTDALSASECEAMGGTYQGDDSLCANVVCPAICGPGAGDCFSANGTVGCEDVECCEAVCAIDPFCCDTEWDGICAGEAAEICGVEAPVNDNCADRVEITDGTTPFSTVGATTDGVDDPLCLFFGSSAIFNDIWYNYTATCDGVLSVSLCGASYDTKLAVYEGTDCPAGPAIACNDDATIGPCSGTLQSYLEVPVECGTTYKIRVGGFGTGSFGSGNITIACNGTPCPAGCPQDCVTSATFAPPPDGVVDGADLANLLGSWSPSPCDPNCCADTVTSATFQPPPDGIVNGADLAALLGAWGNPGCQN